MNRYCLEDINYLRLNYATASKIDLLLNINKSWHSIQKKACQLKIKRIEREIIGKNYGKFLHLLDDTVEAYYWIGLLMADGHFNKNGYITLCLHKKDINHINKFRSFLKLESSYNNLISISDSLTFKLLSEKFKISNNKTYTPCDITNILNNDLLFSLIIGFIDGDGHITKKGGITIVGHENWINNFKIFNKILNNESNKYLYKKSENLISLSVNRKVYFNLIKQKCIDLKLPILNRKWDKINLNKLYKEDKQKYCFNLFDKKLTKNEVISLGVVSRSCVYSAFKNYQTIKNRDIDREIRNFV